MSLHLEHQARLVVADRLRQAEQARLVRSVRASRSRGIKVWDLGSLVVAWAPRRRDSELCRDTPLVLWI